MPPDFWTANWKNGVAINWSSVLETPILRLSEDVESAARYKWVQRSWDRAKLEIQIWESLAYRWYLKL